MHVSKRYDLGRNQPGLDFVDVDLSTDVSVFIDPYAIRLQTSDWSEGCKVLISTFFGALLMAIVEDDADEVHNLLSRLAEPNETHLGYSRGRSRGRGLGGVGAAAVAQRIARSKAAATGLLDDIDDAALMVPGIGIDIVSDMTTHIIRGALVGYTQRACDYYGIPVENQYSGLVWNPNSLQWEEGWTDLPRTDDEPLLLVPKSIVRFRLTLDKDKYYRGFLAPIFENREIDAGSNIVKILKNGSRKVDTTDLMRKYPLGKLAIIDYTEEFPGAYRQYKDQISRISSPLLSHKQLSEALDVPTPRYGELLEKVRSVPTGKASATIYHRAVEQLLTALFYPYLGNMRMEREIHRGRKRIDIVYDNLATLGTFWWFTSQYRAAEIPVECKNYTSDPANPELDQLSSRLAKDRGWIGIIACREFKNKTLFLDRCRDTAKDGRGYLIPLDDADLADLVAERELLEGAKPLERGTFKTIRDRFDYLIS